MLKKSMKYYFVIAILVTIQIIWGCYMNADRIITNDEIFSLGLANNTSDFEFFQNDQVEAFGNEMGWFAGEQYNNYVTVQPEDKWSFANVFKKQGIDNHPPLFYLWVHTLSCFTPDRLNYLGVAFINILSMCGVIVLLYFSMKKIFGDTWYNVVPSIIWVFSNGCNQLTNYIRMYTLLTFFVMCMVYLHICFVLEAEFTKKRLVQLAVTVCLGGLTHYYFYFYCFFLAGTYFVMRALEWRKELKERRTHFIQFVGAYFVGGMTALAIFPKVIKHFLGSSMSQKMQDNAKGGTFPIGETLGVINDNVFHGMGLWVLSGIILLVAFCLIVNKKRQKDTEGQVISNKNFMELCIVLLVPAILFLLVVTKTALYIAWYYVSPAFATIFLATIMLCCFGMVKNRALVTTICCWIFCIGSAFMFLTKCVPTEIQNRQEHVAFLKMIESLRGRDCIYLSESWSCLYGNQLPYMGVMDEVRCITPDDYRNISLQVLLDGRESKEDEIVMIFRKIDDKDTYLRQLEEQTELRGELLYDDGKTAYYSF